MEAVTYISSMGLNVMLKAKKYVEKNGGIFIITNLQPQVKKVFEIVAALPSLKVFASMEEADNYLAEIQRKEIERRGPF